MYSLRFCTYFTLSLLGLSTTYFLLSNVLKKRLVDYSLWDNTTAETGHKMTKNNHRGQILLYQNSHKTFKQRNFQSHTLSTKCFTDIFCFMTPILIHFKEKKEKYKQFLDSSKEKSNIYQLIYIFPPMKTVQFPWWRSIIYILTIMSRPQSQCDPADIF